MASDKHDAVRKTNPTGGPHPGTDKVGSDPNAARQFGDDGKDFGVPAREGKTPDRDYVSANTKASDPGNTHPMAWEHDGVRDHGAGAPDTGPGSASGGDLSPDFIGVGTGGSGIAQSGEIRRPPGPDDSDGTSNEFASGPPAQGRNQTGVHQVGGNRQVSGSTVFGDVDLHTGPVGQGADAATNPSDRGDDSFAGEVSSGEAQGQTLGLSPSSDTQGLSQDDNQGYRKDEADEG